MSETENGIASALIYPLSAIKDTHSVLLDSTTSSACQTLIVQAYTASVQSQPDVDFSDDPGISQYQVKVNDAVSTAKQHCKDYISGVHDPIIANVVNLTNYLELLDATIRSGYTGPELQGVITDLAAQCATWDNNISSLIQNADTVSASFGSDNGSFASIASDFNNAVNGDNGVYADDQKAVKQYQTEIDGCIGGVVGSALAIAGGSVMIAVGAVADFVTAGTSTPVVLGGVAIVAAGIAAEATSAAELHSALQGKASMLEDESRLTTEVKMLTAMSGGFQSLATNAASARDAVAQMSNAWMTLSSAFTAIYNQLSSAKITDSEAMSALSLMLGVFDNSAVQALQNINNQMAGVKPVQLSSSQTVSGWIQSQI